MYWLFSSGVIRTRGLNSRRAPATKRATAARLVAHQEFTGVVVVLGPITEVFVDAHVLAADLDHDPDSVRRVRVRDHLDLVAVESERRLAQPRLDFDLLEPLLKGAIGRNRLDQAFFVLDLFGQLVALAIELLLLVLEQLVDLAAVARLLEVVILEPGE